MNQTFDKAVIAACQADGVDWHSSIPNVTSRAEVAQSNIEPVCSSASQTIASPTPIWLPKPLNMHALAGWTERPVDFVIEDLLPASSVSLLNGLGGSGKTMLIKQLAVAVAADVDVCGFQPRQQGDVVLLLAEDSQGDVYKSIGAVLKELNVDEHTQREALNRMHVFAAAGRDNELLTSSSAGDNPRLESFIHYCKGLPTLRLIGLDPVIALSRARELDEVGQRAVACAAERIALETGAAVVLVNHASKSLQFQDSLHSHTARGSGALTDAVRLEMTMRNMTSKEARQYELSEFDALFHVQFQVTKANRLGPTAMGPRWLRRGNQGVLSSVVLKVKDKMVSSDQRTLSALHLFLRTNAEGSEQNTIALSHSAFRKDAEDSGLLTGETPAAMAMSSKRLIDVLKSKGWINENQIKHLTLTEKGEQALRRAQS